ncbi:signal peptidase I [Enterococcus casseliflavus]|mgnify:FL=1|jgi:signal peptidase I|uniref:signal peptidase I n=1 Tax=Enterococcus TaxID=1350 RepID=UPI001AD631EC|nr:signal peptidase I [Enterococcus casseliflavus]MBO6348302.1 signal peptidase I [Enterococcus casseliflavus]MBO6366776.1 signal peptidase I [Enterococcus casseliflavus]
MWNLGKTEKEKVAANHKMTFAYVLLLLIGVVSVSLIAFFFTQYSIHPVAGSSMEPTIKDGQQVAIKKTQTLQRYATVAFSASSEDGMFIKRIIGVPGDKLIVQNDVLILDFETESAFASTIQVKLQANVAEQLKELHEIPAGYYFVLGDHMAVSKDSRSFGLIKKTQVEGILTAILPSVKGGRQVLIIKGIAIGVILLVFGILASRFLIHYRMEQAKKLTGHPAVFYKKLQILKQLETQKTTLFLMITTLLMGVVVFLLMVSLFQVENQFLQRNEQVTQLEKEVQKIKTQQNEVLSKVTVRSYPEEGIGLADISWEALTKSQEQEALQPKIETELTQKLVPYFGLTQAIISLDVPSQTLSIAMTGATENEENRKKIEDNITAFVAESKEIPKLMQITIEIQMTTEKETETIYEEIFLREKDTDAFSKVEKNEVNEQKGKG